MGKAYRILAEKSLGKQPVEKTEKMDYREVSCGDGTFNEPVEDYTGEYSSIFVTEPLCSITNK
jgi:hypothetical protein